MREEVLRLCRDRVIVRRVVGRDRYGAPVYEEGREVPGYVFPATRAVMQKDGSQVVATGRAILPAVDLGPEDVLEVDGRTWRVLAAARHRDPVTGVVHHVEAELG